MAAPAITPRQTADRKYMLKEGHPTTVAFALQPAVNFWEKSVKPYGVDGGEPIETTTMFNSFWRTKVPPVLLMSPDLTMKVAYDPDVYGKVTNHLVNQNGAITIHFPDGTTLSFYGWLQKFEPEELKERTHPEATVTIVVSNFDPTNGVEESPLLVPFHGT